MISKEYNKYELVCDICGHIEELDSFDEAVDYKKDNKWQSKKINNEWADICPSCKLNCQQYKHNIKGNKKEE